ncbi:MAG: DUF2190 family protein [Alphaproteobacteria bacterium]
MAKNYVQPGDVVTLTAPRTITPGKVVKVGQIIGVAVNGGTSGQACQVALGGVWTIDKATGVPFAQGAAIQWDDSAHAAKAATTGNTYLGVAIVAATSAQTSVTALLNHVKR